MGLLGSVLNGLKFKKHIQGSTLGSGWVEGWVEFRKALSKAVLMEATAGYLILNCNELK